MAAMLMEQAKLNAEQFQRQSQQDQLAWREASEDWQTQTRAMGLMRMSSYRLLSSHWLSCYHQNVKAHKHGMACKDTGYYTRAY